MRIKRSVRRGTVLPMLAVCLIGLFGFVALAVDLGILAVSRTECQNGADASALAACRTLNNKVGVSNSNLGPARTMALDAATGNVNLRTKFTTSQVKKIEVGQYSYDITTQKFKVNTWYDVTAGQNPMPSSGSWTAIRVTLDVAQPTYFMKVFGVNSMPMGAVATAVYRPRDIAFALDMTGSMAFASTFNAAESASASSASLNPDPLVPSAGHYTSIQSALIATSNATNSSGEAISRNNFTITTPGGKPIVRDYTFDPANVSNPATLAYPVNQANLKNAFHRWSPPESGGNSTTYTAVTYDFTGYNAYHNGTESNPKGPTPAPGSFGTMTDSTSPNITYVGDRWRRADGSINKTNTSWSTGSVTTKAATTAVELLGYNVSGSNVRGGTSGTTTITTTDKFRDPAWETYGYDLDIVAYRAAKGAGNPLNPGAFTTLVPTADRFQGFSMGPGYWGKTFFIWPPDPRAPVNQPGQSGYVAGDWRRRYFLNRNGAAFNPQSDNNPNTTGSGNVEGINEVLMNTGSGLPVAGIGSTSSPNWRIDYTAVLKWIKSGPQVLPPNLRAGRVLYYSSIPDDVDTNTGTTQQKLDKAFWKNYIDYVLGWNATGSTNLYGLGDSWSAATRNIGTSDLNTWTGPSGTWSSAKPYMAYHESPNRPRLHFWFGPLSVMDFIWKKNWTPGTVHESQCWQLKAGMNTVLDDIRNNHPNDHVGLALFSYSAYKEIRVPMGQDFTALKNGLFYPKSLLSAINGGDTTTEYRPYNTSFSNLAAGDEIPNANGSTDPNTGLMMAFNLLSPSANLSTSTYGTIKGRRGASKVVIFETDGVPNSYSNFTLNKKGYDTYYTISSSGTGGSNGDSTSISRAVAVAQQIRKEIASTNTTGTDSGLGLPNAPALVYPIAYGDLFDTTLAPSANFRDDAIQFLTDIGVAGGTGLESHQIITGPYEQRITRLKDCLSRIFQSGVSVSLIE